MEGRVTAKIPLGGTLGRLTSGLTELFGTFHWSLVWGEVRLPEKGLMDKWGVAVTCFKFKRPRKDRNVQRSGVWEESACACECRSERALWTWWPGCRGSGGGGGSWGWGVARGPGAQVCMPRPPPSLQVDHTVFTCMPVFLMI